jgi:acetyl-CoA decarbonylase/synthase complex subunit delta
MAKKIKLSELGSLFDDMDVESLEGVTIEGDIELEMDGGGGLDPQLAYMLGNETARIAQHLINISQFMR